MAISYRPRVRNLPHFYASTQNILQPKSNALAKLLRHATALPFGLIAAARLHMVAADHTLDLALRTNAVIDQRDLTRLERAERRLALEYFGMGCRCQTDQTNGYTQNSDFWHQLLQVCAACPR
jgi:hypothetical protein